MVWSSSMMAMVFTAAPLLQVSFSRVAYQRALVKVGGHSVPNSSGISHIRKRDFPSLEAALVSVAGILFAAAAGEVAWWPTIPALQGTARTLLALPMLRRKKPGAANTVPGFGQGTAVPCKLLLPERSTVMGQSPRERKEAQCFGWHWTPQKDWNQGLGDFIPQHPGWRWRWRCWYSPRPGPRRFPHQSR